MSERSPIRRLRRYRPRPRNRPRFKGPSFNRMIPNLMTMLGLCAGLTSMRFGLEGRFGAAAVAISVAAVIDGLYAGADAVDIQIPVTYQDGRQGSLAARVAIHDSETAAQRRGEAVSQRRVA